MACFFRWLRSSDSSTLFGTWAISIVLGGLAVGFGWGGQGESSESGVNANAEGYAVPKEIPSIAADGEAIYSIQCAMCHQPNGQGGQGETGIIPPLSGSEWVTEDKGRVVRIVLHGLTGEVEVKRQTYNGVMPSFGPILSNEEVAEVLTYIRQNFGNEASEVTAREVQKVRQAYSNRKRPWTAEELLESHGIPGVETDEADTMNFSGSDRNSAKDN